jgi:hypothetical protein
MLEPRSRHRMIREFGGAIALHHLLQEPAEIAPNGLRVGVGVA